jgi:hypothetical protein
MKNLLIFFTIIFIQFSLSETKESSEKNSSYLFCKKTHDLYYAETTRANVASGKEFFIIFLKFNNNYIDVGGYYNEEGRFEARTVEMRKFTDGSKSYELIQHAERRSSRNLDRYDLNIIGGGYYKDKCFYQEGGDEGVIDYADCNDSYESPFSINRSNLEFRLDRSSGDYNNAIFGKCALSNQEKYENGFALWVKKAKEQKVLNKEIKNKLIDEKKINIKF